MDVRIEDSCTSCGLCVEICPEVFDMGDLTAEVISNDIPPECIDAVTEAAEECPVEAIVID